MQHVSQLELSCATGFWSPELPRLPEDEQLDAESRKPGQQRFEKLTAGLYMGEITRRILLKCELDIQCLRLCLATFVTLVAP